MLTGPLKSVAKRLELLAEGDAHQCFPMMRRVLLLCSVEANLIGDR